MSDYDFVQKGSLKLKGVSDGGIKKKKKKSKHKEEERASSSVSHSGSGSEARKDEEVADLQSRDEKEAKAYYSSKTKAELAFLKRQEDLAVGRIRSKASVSHKERVEKFNEYLNSLSEHYEPAKVSWTK